MGDQTASGNLEPVAITVKAAETQLGPVIECALLETLTIFIDYVNGDETSLSIIPYSMFEADGDAFQFQTWDATGDEREVTQSIFTLTATGKYAITFDISGTEWCKFHMQAIGGTPTGTIQASYMVSGN